MKWDWVPLVMLLMMSITTRGLAVLYEIGVEKEFASIEVQLNECHREGMRVKNTKQFLSVFNVISKRDRARKPNIFGLNEEIGPRKVAYDRVISVICICHLRSTRLSFRARRS